MNLACSTHGREETFVQHFSRSILRVETTLDFSRTLEYNVKMDLKGTVWEGMGKMAGCC
jgi:hypothetical protein